MHNSNTDDIHPIAGTNPHPVVEDTIHHLRELADELDGWTLSAIDLETYPSMLGLTNIHRDDEVSIPMHVGVMLVPDSTFYVLPFVLQLGVGNEATIVKRGFGEVMETNIPCELGCDLATLRESRENPETSLKGMVERVRKHCEKSG